MDTGAVQLLWKEWAVQMLVLVSFFLQVFLFVFAGMRRRSSSTTLRIALWLAYLLADSTATYTLGHLSIATSSPEHQLVAFWAPFLILHLGGQDTITAYAIEDNRLWLRHLQTLAVQVAAAAYVLHYLLLVGGSRRLVAAAIVMFVVGVVKYGERIWALKCADNNGLYTFIRSYYDITPRTTSGLSDHEQDYREKIVFDGLGTEEEKIMYGAHGLLGVCINLFLGREVEATWQNYNAYNALTHFVDDTSIYRVTEMELSLMYDMMYTKARVIHCWYGLCIRVVSLLAIAASVRLMFLFINEHQDGYKRVDVVITYILVLGALLLEITSGLAILVSTWTRHQLYMREWKWRCLYPAVSSLRRLVMAGSWRRWSDTIGQFNLRHVSTHVPESRITLFDILEDPIGILRYTAHGAWCRLVNVCRKFTRHLFNLKDSEGRTAQISARTKDLILEKIREIARKHNGFTEDMYALNKNRELVLDVDLDTRIIIWYIATQIVLDTQDDDGNTNEGIREDGNCEEEIREDGNTEKKIREDGNCEGKRGAIKLLSDYMLFLLIKHPEMLLGNTRHHIYITTLSWFKQQWRTNSQQPPLHGMQLVRHLLLDADECIREIKDEERDEDERISITIAKRGVEQAEKVLNMGWDGTHQLQAVFGIWVEILCYTGKHCSRDSRARRLSRGGEFLTVVWILTGHLAYYQRTRPWRISSEVLEWPF